MDLEHADLDAFGVDDGPHGDALQQDAPGDVPASSSIETPALIRRAFDWLITGLSDGMSRDDGRTMFFI